MLTCGSDVRPRARVLSRRSTRRRRAFPCSSAAAAAAARRAPRSCASASAATAVPVHRRRAHGDDARAVPPARCRGVAVSGAPSRRRRRAPARGVRRDARVLPGARTAGRRAGHVPARRVPRAADVRELPGLRHVLHDLRRRPRGERQPLRADQPLRRARAAAAARRVARFEVIHMPPLRRRRDEHPRGRRASAAGTSPTTRTYARAHGAGARRRPAGLRARARRRAGRAAKDGAERATRSARWRRCSRPTAALARALRVLLRAAAAPRARLRRAQGDPRILAEEEAADAHRNRAAPAAHARLDQGLPVVARGRGPRRVAAEALQLHRSAAARLGPPALPAGAADRRRPRARGAPLRARPPAAPANRRPRWSRAPAAIGRRRRRKSWGIIEID